MLTTLLPFAEIAVCAAAVEIIEKEPSGCGRGVSIHGHF